jgi:hypothetical protein
MNMTEAFMPMLLQNPQPTPGPPQPVPGPLQPGPLPEVVPPAPTPAPTPPQPTALEWWKACIPS